MAFERSATTQRLAALLTREAVSIAVLAARLGVSFAAALGSARTLAVAGEAVEELVVRPGRRPIRGYRLPVRRGPAAQPVTRETYQGEPRPLRYEPRATPYVSMLVQQRDE